MAKGGQKKQSISGQRQQHEKEGARAETGAGVSNIPVSQTIHKKAAISSADWLKAECDFGNVAKHQIEACCHYEYFRESAAMRKTCVLATCTDQIARSTLTFVLNKVGWKDAAKKNEAPLPWNSLDAAIKEEVSRCVRRCVELENKHPRRHRPLLVQELSPGHHPVEIEFLLEKWKEDAYYNASIQRRLVRPDLFVHDRQRPLSQKFHPAYETNTEMDCPRCFCPIATRIPVRVRRVLAID